MDRLLLLDGMSLAYRAFYGIKGNLTNFNGLHTNAVYGFANMLNKIISELDPSHVLVAFDAGKITFRHDTHKEYKAGRSSMPPEFAEQLPYIKELIELNGINMCEIPLYEADDIIGSYAKKAEKAGFLVDVVSGDFDLLQLVSKQTTVRMTNVKNSGTSFVSYTPEFLFAEKGISPEQIVDLKGFMGDNSDNLPGVPGVGEKRALSLLLEYKTMDNVYAHVESMKKSKMVENIIAYKEQAYMCQELSRLHTTLEGTVSLADLKYEKQVTEELVNFLSKLEMHSILKQLDSDNVDSDNNEKTKYKVEYVLGDEEQAAKIAATEVSYVHVEVLEHQFYDGDVLGISIAISEGVVYFWSLEQLKNSDSLRKWAADCKSKKVVFDGKGCQLVFSQVGFTLLGIVFDELLALYILDPSLKYDDVASIARVYKHDFVMCDEQFYGKGKKRTVPSDLELQNHVCCKAVVLRDLYPLIVADLVKNEQYELLEDIELPLSQVLASMEKIGITLDTNLIKNLGENFSKKMVEVEREIYDLAGREFTIGSPKQLGVVLFEDLNLPTAKKTKTGYSTAIDVLEGLVPYHAIVEKIILYRQLSKLQCTYIDGLMKLVKDDGKLHTRFNQVMTQTGRLSSVEPNLQNIPIRLEEGRKIRQGFVPAYDEWCIMAADYSQIELRVLAHLSEDENLIAPFHSGLDIHSATAMSIFGVSEENITSSMRRQAKAVNFGVVYGISDYGLGKTLNITRKEAAKFIDRYFTMFPKVKSYMEFIVSSARERGYVTTLSNRRRYINDINNSNFNVRSFAERTAMNTPVQGSAADIIKIAMVRLAKRLEVEDLSGRILLQVHDELVLETKRDEVSKLERVVTEEMENVMPLAVPLVVNVSSGSSWYEAK